MKNPNSQLNMLFFSTLIFILIWLTSSSAKGEPASSSPLPLPNYVARYEISWHGIPAGTSVHRLHRRPNGQYHFEATTTPNLAILPYNHVESSHFIWSNNKIYPLNYYYNAKEGKKHKVGNVIFDHTNQTLTNTSLKEPWQTAFAEGIQDKITQTLSLRLALKAGNTDLAFMVAEEDKFKDYIFTTHGKEYLKTKLGMMETMKVSHLSRRGAITTLWLATHLDYLPIKMTQSRKGKLVAGGEIISLSLQ